MKKGRKRERKVKVVKVISNNFKNSKAKATMYTILPRMDGESGEFLQSIESL